METSTLQAMLELMNKFESNKNELKSWLDGMTKNDGTGVLYEMKQIVGANTVLGNSISAVGTTVMEAKAHAITNLTNLHAAVTKYINDTMAAQADYNVSATAITQAVESISWD